MASREELVNKISESLSSINELIAEIKNYKQPDIYLSLREQLKGVSNTITDFEKRKIPVPDQLRQLKATLFNQISEYDETEKAIQHFYLTLQNIISPYQKPEPKGSKSSSGRSRKTPLTSIQLKDLIDEGILFPNTKIIRRGRNETFYGIITQKGQIVVSINGSSKIFDTPSGAAEKLTGRSINGWDWWSVVKDNKEIRLSVFREKYKNL